MIKQKRSKVKQAVLPFVLETTYEIITPRAGLVLFGEFVYGLRLNHLPAGRQEGQINICLCQKVVEGINQKTLFYPLCSCLMPVCPCPQAGGDRQERR